MFSNLRKFGGSRALSPWNASVLKQIRFMPSPFEKYGRTHRLRGMNGNGQVGGLNYHLPNIGLH